jgi:hypothetical protein
LRIDFGNGSFLAQTGSEEETNKPFSCWEREMKEAKRVVVRLEGRAFVFEVDVAEEDLISGMISSLSLFIKRGFPIKVIQTSAPSMGRSQSMWTTILTSVKELGEWLDNLKRLGRVHRGRA